MFSSGLPTLYVVYAFAMIIIFWLDKIQVIYFYKKPKQYDERTFLFTTQMFKWALVLHFIFGSLMLSKDSILDENDTDLYFFDNQSVSMKRFLNTNALVFNISMILIIIFSFTGGRLLQKLGVFYDEY